MRAKQQPERRDRRQIAERIGQLEPENLPLGIRNGRGHYTVGPQLDLLNQGPVHGLEIFAHDARESAVP